MDPLQPTTYLGDAVYARFDGYQIALSLNTHEAEPCVYLEGQVMLKLIKFAKDCGLKVD